MTNLPLADIRVLELGHELKSGGRQRRADESRPDAKQQRLDDELLREPPAGGA